MYDECRVVQTQNNVVRNGLMQFKEIKQQQPQNLNEQTVRRSAEMAGMTQRKPAEWPMLQKLGRQQKGLG